jgi:hypothetical protein
MVSSELVAVGLWLLVQACTWLGGGRLALAAGVLVFVCAVQLASANVLVFLFYSYLDS